MIEQLPLLGFWTAKKIIKQNLNISSCQLFATIFQGPYPCGSFIFRFFSCKTVKDLQRGFVRPCQQFIRNCITVRMWQRIKCVSATNIQVSQYITALKMELVLSFHSQFETGKHLFWENIFPFLSLYNHRKATRNGGLVAVMIKVKKVLPY